MEVVERLTTLCGETQFAGIPCALIRFAGCDLDCRWCDTPYARGKPAATQDLSISDLVEWVTRQQVCLVLLTGGEPLLQPDLPDLAARLAFSQPLPTVMVETSGAHDIASLKPPVVRCVDVKCPSSGEAHRLRHENLDQLRPGDAVKFVIATREDFEYCCQVLRGHQIGSPVNILLSSAYPHLEPGDLARWIIEDLGGDSPMAEARLNVQLHRAMWPELERR